MANGGFNCPTCGNPFKTKQGLRVHINRTHARKARKAAESKLQKPPKWRRKPKPEE